mmetsp:Transcript_35806/g.47118  ORF Transcript_35806/g.47118 Transcript_35806/m.47118 type:complete len:122 (+) Transcript_35806:2710-3075(+)
MTRLGLSCRAGLLLDEASEIVAHQMVIVLVKRLLLGSRRLLGLLVNTKELPLGLLYPDFLRRVVSGHGEENRLLEAEGALSDKASLALIAACSTVYVLLDQGRFLPDLLNGILVEPVVLGE